MNLQDQFENEFILGNYVKSEQLLNKIENEICKSIWSMEKRFMQEEYQNGLEGNKKFLKRVNEVNNEPIIYFLSHFMSFKVEENTTFQQYYNNFQKLKESIKNEMLVSYLNYKLNYQYSLSNVEISNILMLEGTSSIIDRYLTTIKICKHIITDPDFEFYHKHIFRYFEEISRFINDPNITNVLLLHNPENRIKNLNHGLIQISDLYTLGNYKDALKYSKNMIENQSNVFELYEFYLKSYMYIDSQCSPVSEKNNLQNKILEAMYNTYIKNDKFFESLKDLLKISILLGDFDISVKISAFLTRKHFKELNAQVNMYSELSSKYISPRFSLIYSDKFKSMEFLGNMDKETIYKQTINFFDATYRNYDNSNLIHIPTIRKNFQLVRVLMDNGLYEKSISLLERVLIDISSLQEKPISTYIFEKANVLLYNSFLNTRKLLKCMEIYVNNYLINPILTTRMDIEVLVSQIENEDSDELKASIYTPILCYLHYKNDSTKVYRSYANYMDLNCYDMPSEIINNKFNKSQIKLLIFFLSKICSPEVLESSVLMFESEEDVRKERINICQRLLELDNTNEYEYIKEITELTQKIKVKAKLRELDESRIDINVKGIKNDPDSIFNENFKRFIQSKKTFIDLLVLDINDIKTISDLNDIRELKKNLRVQDQSLLLFKDALCDLRDQFAFNSKYGLDSSLSTRVRHGALFNELRRPFEIFNLILSKKKKDIDIYDLSSHWERYLSENKILDLKKTLKNILGIFSKKVDQKIDFINNNYMRIRTEAKNPYGLFYFVLNDYDILDVYYHFNNNSTEDSEEFFDIIMQIMWTSTENSLKVIREILKNEIQNDFLLYLDELQEEIRCIKDNNNEKLITELSTDIINCRIELQSQIEKISNWFKLSKNTEYSDFDSLVLVDTCIETLGNLNKYKKVVIEKEVNTDFIFKGYAFTYLIDILNIFINNAMQHSKFDDLADLIIRISINEEHDFINLKVENNLSHGVDKDALQLKIKEINSKVNDFEFIKKYHSSEGGSGYIKIFKILYYNLITQFKINLNIKHPNTFQVIISIKKEGLTNNKVEESAE